MAITKAVVLLVVGAVIIRAALSEAYGWFRARGRIRRTTGVIVGHTDPRGIEPLIRTRSTRFRFTTEDRRVVERVSAAHSYPGPKIGRQVSIVYDTAHPQRSAERAGVLWVKLLLTLPLLALGVFLAGYGITFLL